MDDSSPKKTPWQRIFANPEMLVALSAVLIGVCALVVSVMQTRLMQQEQRMNVWPRLEILYTNSRNDSVSRFEINIYNKGIGPALIDALQVNLDNRAIQRWEESFGGYATNMSQSRVTNRTLLPGEEVKLLAIQTDSVGLASIMSTFARIQIRLCYSSVYEEHWLVSRKETHGQAFLTHQAIEACTIDPKMRFSR